MRKKYAKTQTHIYTSYEAISLCCEIFNWKGSATYKQTNKKNPEPNPANNGYLSVNECNCGCWEFVNQTNRSNCQAEDKGRVSDRKAATKNYVTNQSKFWMTI